MNSTDLPALLYLWERRTFYLGPLLEPMKLDQSAATLVVSLGCALDFICAGQSFSSRSALLPPGISLTLLPHEQTVAVCYLDPFGEDFCWLSAQFQQQRGAIFSDVCEEGELIAQLTDLHRTTAAPDQVAAYLQRLISPSDEPTQPRVIDPRIISTVALIKADVSSNLTAEYLAQQVGLSVPRLTQLFRETVGIPMRRYRQWHRLYVSTTRVAQGMSLTAASLEAGFADSAHFCNTFRSIIGMKPSKLLSQPERVRLFAG